MNKQCEDHGKKIVHGVASSSPRGKLAAALFALFAASASHAAALPEGVAKQLGESLPAAFTPIPASGSAKMFPVVSEKMQSYDRKYAISIEGSPFAVTAVGEGGKVVEMLVPAGLHSKEFTKRWFKVDDVFGKVKWNLEPYEPAVPCLAYFNGGKTGEELVAKIPKGTSCTSLGTVALGKSKFRLVQLRQTFSAAGEECPFMVVCVRENPPVTTQSEYDARAKQLMAEHAFREGRPWGTMFPSLLGNTGCFECAAMAADFSTYMFDGGLQTGERFDKADDIRSGDVIYKANHFFAVVYRKGAQLTTIEGNMNASVSKSTTRYAVKDGKLLSGGKDACFEYGYHNWTPAVGKRGK